MLFARSIVLLAVTAITVIAIYLTCYNRIINRRMQQSEGGKPLPSPARIMRTAAWICAAGAILLLSISALTDTQTTTVTGVRSSLQVFPAENIPDSWAGVYSVEHNPGYTRREAKDGAFSFTVFESETTYDGLHPDFLVWVRYEGKETMEALSWTGSYAFDGERRSGVSAAGGMSPYLLAAGSAEEGAVFTLTVSTFASTEQAKALATGEADAATHASASGSVTLMLHGGVSQ